MAAFLCVGFYRNTFVIILFLINHIHVLKYILQWLLDYIRRTYYDSQDWFISGATNYLC